MTGAILVVDDERDLAVTCERLLRRRGWSVLTTGTREGGLAILGREPRPALAIVDRQLPDGDGPVAPGLPPIAPLIEQAAPRLHGVSSLCSWL